MTFAARQTQLGPLDCTIVDDGDQPNALVVICHGYGAPGTDLVPLAGEWISLLGDRARNVRFVFPSAPNSLAEIGMPGGRAWWPINMAQLMNAVEAEKFEELHTHQPPGIDTARDALSETINAAIAQLDAPEPTLVLGGFSQGAMLTMDTTLRGHIAAPEVLIQFSGTLVCESQWQQNITRLENSVVYQSHGSVDPVLPYASAQSLHELICTGRSDAKFHSFYGPHTIDPASLTATAELIRNSIA